MHVQKFPCVPACSWHEGYTVLACVLFSKDGQCTPRAVDLNNWPLLSPYRTAIQYTLCRHRMSCLRSKFHNTENCLWSAIQWGKKLLAKLSVPYENNYAKIMYISIENLEGFSPKCKHRENPRGLEHTMLSLWRAHGHLLERRVVAAVLAHATLLKCVFPFSSVYEMAPCRLATAPTIVADSSFCSMCFPAFSRGYALTMFVLIF